MHLNILQCPELHIVNLEDYQLPSVTTLTRLISKVGNTDDLTFIKEVVSGVTEKQRTVIRMADEVYVKYTLS